MVPIAHLLNQMGSHTLILSLSGHFTPIPSDEAKRALKITEVSRTVWLAETMIGYQMARELAEKHQLPLYFLGYSLGGALGLDLLHGRNKDIHYNKMILFAPAIALNPLVSCLKFVPNQAKIHLPSLSPTPYRANGYTSMNAYHALFQSIEFLTQSAFRKAGLACLIFVDPQDEFVSLKKITRLRHQYQLFEWHIEPIVAQPDHGSKTWHHLIIDQSSVGQATWNQIGNTMKTFLA